MIRFISSEEEKLIEELTKQYNLDEMQSKYIVLNQPKIEIDQLEAAYAEALDIVKELNSSYSKIVQNLEDVLSKLITLNNGSDTELVEETIYDIQYYRDRLRETKKVIDSTSKMLKHLKHR